VERVYDDYAALLAAPGIDIVYLAVPHNFHCALALQAIAAGKAVFCEKPLGVDAREAARMIEAARAQKVFLMEAVKTRFMPALHTAQRWIREGRIGQPRLLHAFFAFNAGGDPVGRHLNPDLAGGALLDLGVYPLTLAEMLLGTDPELTQASARLAPTGVDASTAITLRYRNGALAQLYVTVEHSVGTFARLWGESGYIDIPRFNQAHEVTLHAEGRTETFRQDGPGVFTGEVNEANRCLREGLLESPRMSWADSLRLASWQDAILARVHGRAGGR
jgi:dihydrodiol dehydrogenase / D-xylose 1-dehydrogenase (NADP)